MGWGGNAGSQTLLKNIANARVREATTDSLQLVLQTWTVALDHMSRSVMAETLGAKLAHKTLRHRAFL